MKKNVIPNKILQDDILKIFTDGASRGNPGKSSWAFAFYKNDEEDCVYHEAKYMGEGTNNKAEYEAIIHALDKASGYTRKKVEVYSDSELVIKQINGDYRVKKDHLKEKLDKVLQLRLRFESIEFYNVRRGNKNIQYCDTLCNQELDKFTA